MTYLIGFIVILMHILFFIFKHKFKQNNDLELCHLMLIGLTFMLASIQIQ